ncbi:MAG: protein kinase [Actinomycetota bacterium]
MPDTRSMDTVGGYRLVRKLGSGERAEVHLGHAGHGESPDSDRIAAIKVYRPSTDDTSIDHEIECLARASSRHLLELRDLATGPDGRPCLILPRLGSGTLGRLLAVRGTVDPGEAVSILAPLVDAVRDLHRVGVAHGAVSAGSVLFDDRGAPVLAGFGSAMPIGDFPVTDGGQSLTPAQLDGDRRAVGDRVGLRDLVTTVLDRLASGAAPGALAELREWVSGPPPAEAGLSRLTDLLFDLAPATLIRFDDDGVSEPSASLVPFRRHQSSEATGARPVEHTRGADPPVASLPPWAQPTEIGGRDEHPFVRVRARMIALLAPVRTPVWIAGGAGLGALVIALTVIPGAQSSTGPGPFPSTPRSIATQPVPRNPARSQAASDASAPTKATPSSPAATSAIEGQDPLAAARALLAARADCFTARSTTCFDTVDQAGSAVIEADRDLVRRLKAGTPLPAEATLAGFTPRLIQQLGDSAIIQLVGTDGNAVSDKSPAPLLLVRNEAGWRIRDLALG